jgi:hypothetical protein
MITEFSETLELISKVQKIFSIKEQSTVVEGVGIVSYSSCVFKIRVPQYIRLKRDSTVVEIRYILWIYRKCSDVNGTILYSRDNFRVKTNLNWFDFKELIRNIKELVKIDFTMNDLDELTNSYSFCSPLSSQDLIISDILM